jgi:hypothetical protein
MPFSSSYFEETSLTLNYDDLTFLSDAPVHVAWLGDRRLHVYVFSAFVPVPYVTTNVRTPAKLEHVVNAQSTINSYIMVLTSYQQRLPLTVFCLPRLSMGSFQRYHASSSYFTWFT